MAETKTKRKPPCTQLDGLRLEIEHLYCVERRTVAQIRDVINEKHGLNATYYQFRERLAKWGCRKNLNAAQLDALQLQMKARTGKRSGAVISTSSQSSIPLIISPQKLARSSRRHEQNTTLLEKIKKSIAVAPQSAPAAGPVVTYEPAVNPTEQAIIVFTPESTESSPRGGGIEIQSHGGLQSLPILQAVGDWAKLCYAWGKIHYTRSQGDISTAKGQPHFVLVYLIVWKVSNNLLIYSHYEVNMLLEKVEMLGCLPALIRLFSSRQYSIRTTAEKVVPVLMYRGKLEAAWKILEMQGSYESQLYWMLSEGQPMSNNIGPYFSDRTSSLASYYNPILSRIIETKTMPLSLKDALMGIKACRVSGIPISTLAQTWSSISSIVGEIERYSREKRGSKYRSIFDELEMLYWPVLNESVNDIEPLLSCGFRDGLHFYLLDCILNATSHEILKYLPYSQVSSKFQAELEKSISCADESQRIWDGLEETAFEEIVTLVAEEIASFMAFSRTLPEKLWTEERHRSSVFRAAVLLYHGRVGAPYATLLSTIFGRTVGYDIPQEDMRTALEIAVQIYRIFANSAKQAQESFTLEYKIAERPFFSQKIHWLCSLAQETGSLTSKCGAEFDNRNTTQANMDIDAEIAFSMVNVALKCNKPTLLTFLMEEIDLNQMKMVTHPRSEQEIHLSQALFEGVREWNPETVSELWYERLDQLDFDTSDRESNPDPVLIEMEEALEYLDKDTLELRQLALKYLHHQPHPIVSLLQSRRLKMRATDVRDVNRSPFEDACFDLLLWLLDEFFQKKTIIATDESLASMKVLHWDTMELILKNNEIYGNLFPDFYPYGAQVDRLSFHGELRPSPDHRTSLHDNTYMNMSCRTINFYGLRRLETFKILLESGYDVDRLDELESFLEESIISNNVEEVLCLLERGVSMCAQGITSEGAQFIVSVAGRRAVCYGRIDMLAVLLDKYPMCWKGVLEDAIAQNKFAISDMIRESRAARESDLFWGDDLDDIEEIPKDGHTVSLAKQFTRVESIVKSIEGHDRNPLPRDSEGALTITLDEDLEMQDILSD